MIPFIQKTWFLWWILAVLVTLRWFHLFSSRRYETILEEIDSNQAAASTASEQMPGTASRLFT